MPISCLYTLDPPAVSLIERVGVVPIDRIDETCKRDNRAKSLILRHHETLGKGLGYVDGIEDLTNTPDRAELYRTRAGIFTLMQRPTQREWPSPTTGRMLLEFRGIGAEFAASLWLEALFRHFDNRRQLASYAGLAPTPWQSGSVDREQGVSKAGNPRLRTTLIQLAWLWLRHQRQSALALWFKERVNRNGGRLKKTTIVALARKLLVALWKYVTAGVVIEGAVMKDA